MRLLQHYIASNPVVATLPFSSAILPLNYLIRGSGLMINVREIISMQSKFVKLAGVAAGVAFVAAAFSLPANAHDLYRGYRHHHYHHYSYYGRSHSYYGRPLTVTSRHVYAPVVAGPNPYYGPGAIVTAPNAAAATVVSLPFRAVNTIFPPYGNTPLVLIGAPVHAAAMIAEFPFYVVGSAFGAPPNVVY